MGKQSFYLFYKGLSVLDAYTFGLQKKMYKEKPVYLDIGGRGGLGKKWHLLERASMIKSIIVEPDPDEAKKLEQKYPNACVIQCGLGDKAIEANLNICSDSGKSSILEPNNDFLKLIGYDDGYKVVDNIRVSLISFQEIANNLQLNSLDFVKIDTQGFEYKILQGFGDLLNRVLCLELEVQHMEFYKEQKKFAEIFEYLFNRGFSLVDLRPLGIFNEFGILECNAYFVRRGELKSSELDKVTFWKKVLSIPSHEDYVSRS